MPKITLVFNLPEEREELETTMSAGAMSAALWEFSNFLRSKTKYGEFPEAEMAVYELIREEFHRCLQEHDVEI